MVHEKLSIEQIREKINEIQVDSNNRILNILKLSDSAICINAAPTYLSHVKIEDGYPIQLDICKWDGNKRPCQPIFGEGIS